MKWGRWEVTIRREPRDKWIGVFGPDDRGERDPRAWRPGFHPDDYGTMRHVYICLIPCVVIHARRWLKPARNPQDLPSWESGVREVARR